MPTIKLTTPTITVPGADREFRFAFAAHDTTGHLVPDGRMSALCDPERQRHRVFPADPAAAFGFHLCADCHRIALQWAGRSAHLPPAAPGGPDAA